MQKKPLSKGLFLWCRPVKIKISAAFKTDFFRPLKCGQNIIIFLLKQRVIKGKDYE
ncbi:hypothetical protein DNO_0621 [Dichelobacter nodosus VCS1703A]|uniref:Uncharacterized protein n=1 Tax=Dichelobacter nodosus (strain VCS1703A) TaxID=246195 RepID=A5EVC8_DICNV|nr:hypothetical protein DNO_0621 [Dichelobacter nodosus VCS1703A]